MTRQTDPRLPPVGGKITKTYKGRELTVVVREDGFEFDGYIYNSLTALAEDIVKRPKSSKGRVSGFSFFGLGTKPKSTDVRKALETLERAAQYDSSLLALAEKVRKKVG